jgi:hypothetical protein
VVIWSLYLLVSVLTYVGLLRTAFHEFGPDWFGPIFALTAFVPVAGQALWVIIGLQVYGPPFHLGVPRWLRWLGGVK